MKINKYTIIDVETPNSSNNSICSIAIIHVNDNEITYCKEHLVNPEARFDNFNIGIHHISPQMVENALTFPSIWMEIKQFFTNGIIIAHNATFDLNVLGKVLTAYDIAVPEFYYICTMQKARRHITKDDCESYKLNALCNKFQITLENHHNSMCDTIACKNLFEIFVRDYGISDCDVKSYVCNSTAGSSSLKTVLQKGMNTLFGIISGIGYDNIIYEKEHSAIYNWMEEYKDFKKDDEFNKCYHLLQNILSDGIITQEEYNSLIDGVSIHMTSTQYSDSTLAMQVLMGIIKGVSADKKINLIEAKELLNWMELHANLRGNYPFDNILNTLEKVMEDGIMDGDEEQELLNIFDQFLNPKQSKDTDIKFEGNLFCLTGTFSIGTKADVEKFIVSKGGSCTSGLTMNVHCLVVGGQGNTAWKFGNYGGKINKALQMQEKGGEIRIVSEETLYSF